MRTGSAVRLSSLKSGIPRPHLQRQAAQRESFSCGSMQIRDALKAVQRINQVQSALALSRATVSEVLPLGLGDRVCVDLCDNLAPGEGMLVGNFCRGLFLVHSEVRIHKIWYPMTSKQCSRGPLGTGGPARAQTVL
jgi:hypothetical protein